MTKVQSDIRALVEFLKEGQKECGWAFFWPMVCFAAVLLFLLITTFPFCLLVVLVIVGYVIDCIHYGNNLKE